LFSVCDQPVIDKEEIDEKMSDYSGDLIFGCLQSYADGTVVSNRTGTASGRLSFLHRLMCGAALAASRLSP
jgi:hypothetical protein